MKTLEIQEKAETLTVMALIAMVILGFVIMAMSGFVGEDLSRSYLLTGACIMIGGVWCLPILGWVETRPQEFWARQAGEESIPPLPMPTQGAGTCILCGSLWYRDHETQSCPTCGISAEEPCGQPLWLRPGGTMCRGLDKIPMSESRAWTGTHEILLGFENVSPAWVPGKRS